MDKEISEQLKKATELFFEPSEETGKEVKIEEQRVDLSKYKRDIEPVAYQCNACGRTFTDKGDIDFTQNLFHDFAAYTGYSSPLDDEKIEFMLCERCLMDIFRGFKHQPMVHGQNVVEWYDQVKEGYYEELDELERC